MKWPLRWIKKGGKEMKSDFVALQIGCWNSLSKERLDGGVDVANAAQGRSAHELAVGNHEVGVAVEVVESLELGDDVVHEAADLVVRVNGGKLGQPDGLATANIVGVLEVGEEGVGVLGLGVPVDVAKVNLAAVDAVAGSHELLEPVETLAGLATVADRGSTNLDLAGVLAHVLGVSSGGGTGRHVGLARHVGLVEAEELLAAIGDGGLGVLVPVAGVDRKVTPERGNEVLLARDATARGAPVVEPAAVVLADVAERLGEVGVVVSDTTLGEAGRTTSRASRLGLLGAGKQVAKVNADVDASVVSGLGSRGLGSGLGGSVLDNDSRGDDGVVVGKVLGLGGGSLLVVGHVDGLEDGLPDDAALLSLVVSMAVGVERLGLAGDGGEDGESGNGVGVHLGSSGSVDDIGFRFRFFLVVFIRTVGDDQMVWLSESRRVRL